MKVSATTKYLKISAQKLRLSADSVRNKRAIEAQELLLTMQQKSARLVYDGLKSAMANAENNYSLNKASLQISEIRVDQGPSLKRIRPRARGSASPIVHPMAHLHIVLDDTSPDKTKSALAEKPVVKPTKPKVTTTIKKRGKK